MSEAKYTPGPWQWYHPIGAEHNKQRFVSRPGHLAHADVYGEANARLIAAAPELLEALEEAAYMLNDNVSPEDNHDVIDCLNKIRAVIARAKNK
jgi:hypothetical protein